VGDLQTLVTRRFDVFDPAVVTIGLFQGGTAANVIPDDASFEATVRTFSESAHERMRDEAVRLCEHVAAGYGLEIDVEYKYEYPVTVNNAEHARWAAEVATEVFGEDGYQPMESPLTGAEDFSRVLAEVPGCYLFLGACTGDDWQGAPSNHSPRASFDDSVLPQGVLLHAELAIRALRRDAAAAGRR
jgi:amidohydrolase